MSGISSAHRRVEGARPSRFLIYVLLMVIAYGSSVGAAHHHDGLASTNPQSLAGAPTDARLIDVGTVPSGPTKPGECQICQFRQSLSNGVIFTAVLALEPIASGPLATVPTELLSSANQTASQGRAPPVIS
jgi:hypothetical protein